MKINIQDRNTTVFTKHIVHTKKEITVGVYARPIIPIENFRDGRCVVRADTLVTVDEMKLTRLSEAFTNEMKKLATREEAFAVVGHPAAEGHDATVGRNGVETGEFAPGLDEGAGAG